MQCLCGCGVQHTCDARVHEREREIGDNTFILRLGAVVTRKGDVHKVGWRTLENRRKTRKRKEWGTLETIAIGKNQCLSNENVLYILCFVF